MERWLHFIPFLMVKNYDGHDVPGIRFQRIFEGIVIAVIAGLFSAYLTMKQIEVRIEYIQKQIDRIEMRINANP